MPNPNVASGYSPVAGNAMRRSATEPTAPKASPMATPTASS